jgi:hypothetical protein
VSVATKQVTKLKKPIFSNQSNPKAPPVAKTPSLKRRQTFSKRKAGHLEQREVQLQLPYLKTRKLLKKTLLKKALLKTNLLKKALLKKDLLVKGELSLRKVRNRKVLSKKKKRI